MEVREALYQCSHDDSDFDLALKVWCVAAEDGLLAASRAAGGPLPQKSGRFRDGARWRSAAGGLEVVLLEGFHRPVQAEDVDNANCHFPLTPHLALVILLWRPRASPNSQLLQSSQSKRPAGDKADGDDSPRKFMVGTDDDDLLIDQLGQPSDFKPDLAQESL